METDATNLTPAIALDGLAGCVSLAEAPSAPCPEITLGCGGLRLEDVHSVARNFSKVTLSADAASRIDASRSLLMAALDRGDVVYGVTTGYGGNSKYLICPSRYRESQANLLRFLAAGCGPDQPQDVVRAQMLARVNAIARGYSGVRQEVVRQLLFFLNRGIAPRVPKYGSVGASGDLIPSCYVARALCGLGEVLFQGSLMSAGDALARSGGAPVELEAKEGLGLLNGTASMTAYAALAVSDLEYTFGIAIAACALSVEAMQSCVECFDERIQAVKGHDGQVAVGRVLRQLLAGSKLTATAAGLPASVADSEPSPEFGVRRAAQNMQPVYSLRCIPQGLGPVWDSLVHARRVVEQEINSANDNPLIDPDRGDILHGGNFYGGHIARELDGLKLDIANLANWTHSIMALLMDSRFSRGLPDSLSPRLGIFQGFKGVQIAHSSLVTVIRRESAPSSIHTLPTEQFNQDIVSLGTHAACTTFDMLPLLRDAVAMTLLAAAQAVDLRKGVSKLAQATARVYRAVRSVSDGLNEDRPLDADICALSTLIARRQLEILPMFHASLKPHHKQ